MPIKAIHPTGANNHGLFAVCQYGLVALQLGACVNTFWGNSIGFNEGGVLLSVIHVVGRNMQQPGIVLLAGFFLLVTYHDSMRLKKRIEKPVESAEMPVFEKKAK